MRRVAGSVAVLATVGALTLMVTFALWRSVENTELVARRDEQTLETARLQSVLVEVFESLMAERGAADVFGPGTGELRRAQQRTDVAISGLRATWEAVGEATKQRTGLDELLSGLAGLDRLRAGGGSESYSLMVGATTMALRDANLATLDDRSIANRRRLTALVDLMASLGQQRRLVGLGYGRTFDESTRTEIALTIEQADGAVERLAELHDGPGSLQGDVERDPRVETAVAALLAGDDEAAPPDARGWWDLATNEISEVRARVDVVSNELIDSLHQSIDDRWRERDLEWLAIVATLVLGVTVAGGTNALIRRRRNIADEYAEIASGIRAWFHATTLPELDGVTAAAAYLPAADHAKAGGDWFDLFSVDHLAIGVVGDVVGHGTSATADMARVRHLLRGLVTDPVDTSLLTRVERRLGDPPMMATLAVVAVDPGTLGIRYLRAGHPPPIVRRVDGTVDVLWEGANPMVGAGLVPAEPAASGVLGAGDVLVLYTDGLVERPGEVITDSVRALVERVAGGPSGPAELVAHLTDGLTDRRDDIALLVLRVTDRQAPD